MTLKQVCFWGLVAITIWTGCRGSNSVIGSSKLITTQAAIFTYATSAGAIWQMDIAGHKTHLWPDDGLHKMQLTWSPSQQWLAYLTIELIQTGTRIEGLPNGGEQTVPTYRSEQTLMVIDAAGNKLNLPIRAAPSVVYRWEDSHTINLWLSDIPRATPSDSSWERYTVDVETGSISEVLIETEDWQPSAPGPVPSPDGKWAYDFERREDSVSAYLLDMSGNKVATLFNWLGEFGDVTISWSPDSYYVLYSVPSLEVQEDPHDVYVYDVRAETSIRLTTFATQEGFFEMISPEWSPTGEWVFFRLFTEEFGDLYPCLVHVASNDLHCFEISSKGGEYIWSLDGRYLATIGPAGSEPVDVYVIDARLGELTNLTRDGNDTQETDLARMQAPGLSSED